MRDENITISHSSFICIKSNVQNIHVRLLIFVAKNAKKFTCTSRSDIVNSKDMQAISIANNKIQKEILLFRYILDFSRLQAFTKAFIFDCIEFEAHMRMKVFV